MNDNTLTRITRAIALADKIGKREFYWSSVCVTTESERITVSCVVTVDDKTLLSFNNEATETDLDELIRQLEFTKNETLEDARDVLYHNKRGY